MQIPSDEPATAGSRRAAAANSWFTALNSALSSSLGRGAYTHNTAATRCAQAGKIRFAYRRFGEPVGMRSQFQFAEQFNRCLTDFLDR